MANILRHLLLFLSLIVLISFATCDISGPNMNCEISCAFNYSQVSFFNAFSQVRNLFVTPSHCNFLGSSVYL